MTYSFNEVTKLDQLKKYLPENVLLGRIDKIGGIMECHPKRKKNKFLIFIVDLNAEH